MVESSPIRYPWRRALLDDLLAWVSLLFPSPFGILARFLAACYDKSEKSCNWSRPDGSTEPGRENDWCWKDSFYLQLPDAAERAYALLDSSAERRGTVTKCSNCGRENRAPKVCKYLRKRSSRHTIGWGMAVSPRTKVFHLAILLYHEFAHAFDILPQIG